MDYEFLLYGVDVQGIATITLNRPDKLNAVHRPMSRELIAVMDEVDSDDRVRAAIVTGAGRGYCAGADLSGGSTIFDRGADESFDMQRDADFGGYVSRRLFECTKPLIAAINGPAVGFGASTTLPMDFRLASTAARFGFVFTRRGLVPEAASSWFLPRLVGVSQALEWVYSGRVFDAEEALRGGLVRSIHEPDRLLADARAFAVELTKDSSAVAIAVARRMIWQMYGTGSPEIAHELDSRGIYTLGRSADCAEGVAAFIGKRPAKFPMSVSHDLPDYVRRWQKAGLAEDFLREERDDGARR
jgi:enoyl-CoA hydratase/carnithine racemase